MKIADLDPSTRHLIFAAHCMAKFPGDINLKRLQASVAAYDEAHREERDFNLINALWGPKGIMNEPDAEDE